MCEPYDYQIDLNLSKYNGRYPRDDLIRAKKQAFEDLHQSTSESILEIIIKHKCGILTKDVIDFRLYDKKPSDKFNDSLEFINPRFDLKTYSPLSNQIITNNNNNQDTRKVIANSKPINIENMSRKIIKEEEIDDNVVAETRKVTIDNGNNKDNGMVIIDNGKDNGRKVTIDKPTENSTKSSITIVKDFYKNDLNIEHGCKLCPRNLRLNKNSKKEFPSAKVGYICDFCNEIKFDKEIMEAHLVENAHSSASKYLIESSDSNKNYKLCAILSRASLKNNGTKHVEKNSVFCPKCKIYFEDVLTCGIHFKTNHSVSELVYSISRKKNERLFKLDESDLGKHTCIECKQSFKKLKDLTFHMTETKHFPQSQNGDINVIFCPIKDCSYRTNYYNQFKVHILTIHKNDANRDKVTFSKLICKVEIYPDPIIFFHVPPFMEEFLSERNEEEIILSSLINYVRGKNDPGESKLKDRRNYLKSR